MADIKITKKDKFNMILPLVADNEMLTEFITHEIELLNRKSSKSATLSPAQKDALAVGEIVRDVLSECEDNKGMTVGAILKDERIKSYTKADGNTVSSQMITAILSKNTADFKRTLDKKVAYYSLNYGVDEGEVEGV